MTGARRVPSPGRGRDEQPDGVTGAVVAVVLLALGSGIAALYSMFMLPYASDSCADSDTRFVCTGQGQQAVVVGPSLTAVVGIVVAACACALPRRYRPWGIFLGYLIAFGGFLVALAMASQA